MDTLSRTWDLVHCLIRTSGKKLIRSPNSYSSTKKILLTVVIFYICYKITVFLLLSVYVCVLLFSKWASQSKTLSWSSGSDSCCFRQGCFGVFPHWTTSTDCKLDETRYYSVLRQKIFEPYIQFVLDWFISIVGVFTNTILLLLCDYLICYCCCYIGILAVWPLLPGLYPGHSATQLCLKKHHISGPFLNWSLENCGHLDGRLFQTDGPATAKNMHLCWCCWFFHYSGYKA